MSEKELIPKRRFKEFENDGEWEEKKLGDISDMITKGTTPIDKSWLGPVNYIKTESIDKQSGILIRTSNTSLKEHEGFLKRSQLKSEDVLFSIVGTLGRIGIVRTHDLPANTNQQIAIIRLKEIDSYFIMNELKSPRIRLFVLRERTIGAQPSLSLWQINKIKILLPSLPEQEKIGNFFQSLDKLISLNQDKLNKLKETKSAYLSEMFPKEGELYPRRRFAGFTEPWEEKKFDKEVEFYPGLTYSPSNINTVGTFVLRSSNVKNGKVVDADNVYVSSNTVNSANVREGDIIVVVRNGSRSLIGKHAQIKQDMKNTVIGAFMTGIRSTQSCFINALMDTKQFRDEIEKNLGATINQITNSMFSEMEFRFPSLPEQEKIGNFFKELDELINLQDNKLKKLEALKKAYLNEMFV